MSIIENSNVFIFIDGSYYCFYRYYSVVNWWKKSHPNELNVLEDPINNSVFVDKYKSTFIDNINKMANNLQLYKSNNNNVTLFVGKDCKRGDIWRHKYIDNYKTTRKPTPKEGYFLSLSYDDNLFEKANVNMLSHLNLEGDDCIAIMSNHVSKLYLNCHIFIISSDKDYLQLVSPRVHLYNLAYKRLNEQTSSSGNSSCDLFCKIVGGDKSDNIPSVFPKCGIKTALKYFNNPDLFTKRLNEDEKFQKQFEINKLVIDFHFIPKDLENEFLRNNKHTNIQT